MLPILLGILGLLTFALFTAILYARWHYGVLENLGIPVVAKPSFLLGNTLEFCSQPGGLNDIKWMNKFGPVYGVS